MLYLARRKMPALFGGAAAVIPWYLSGGISAANCIIAYQPKGAASLAASYVNLANPGTYDAAPGTAPTFAAATGWTFASASSQYLSTQYATDGRNHTLLIRFSGASGTADKYLVGSTQAGGGILSGIPFILAPSGYFAGRYYNHQFGSVTVAPRAGSGVMGVTINRDTTTYKAYFDGNEDGTLSAPEDVSTATKTVAIGTDTSAYGFIDASVQAFAIYNRALNATEMAAVSAAMAAL